MKKILVLLVIALLLLTGCEYSLFKEKNSTADTVLLDLNLSDETVQEITDNDNLEISEVETEDKTDTDTEEEASSTEEELESSTEEQDFDLEKSFKEGDLIKFNKDKISDPDNDKLKVEFSAPLNEDGEWKTEIGDAGVKYVTITVSDGEFSSIKTIKLNIIAVNKLPVISNFEDITVKEGETIELNPEVSDEDGDELVISYTGFMTSSEKETGFNDAGNYEVTLSANDGKQTATKTISIEIENVNRAPKLNSIKDINVLEGETVTIEAEANDPDNDAVSITFSSPLNEDGTWETTSKDVGSNEVTITASDGDLTDEETVTIKVKALNNAPTLVVASEIEVNEGETIVIDPVVADKDGDSLKITYSGYMTSSQKVTNYDDAGEYETTVSVTDGKETVTETIQIIVKDTNRAPTFIGDDLFE